jgi:hypothetical protein
MRRAFLAAGLLAISSTSALASNGQSDRDWCLSLPVIQAQARDPVAACDYVAERMLNLHVAYEACEASGRERCDVSLRRLIDLALPDILGKALAQ